MLFNSIDFAIFFPIVFFSYWFLTLGKIKLQNVLIVVASYIFYGSWDYRFLSLILFSTVIDYTVGICLKNQKNLLKRKLLLWTSILVNIGLLGVFKYYNFFIDNFISAFSLFGAELKANSLNFILPVGISFYTFQTLSYTIDVYKKKLEPTKDFIAFSAFVSFFPQLVAGPIERASNLLPQFNVKRSFDYVKAVDGSRQILWGLFKKIVIADNSAEYANIIFNNSGDYSGSTLALGVFFFAVQIYGDFSGYSDIAIGSARLLGFNLKRNFAFPYFSRDIAEFWRRWHISLSTWFRDYVYIPLGGSKVDTWTKIRNIFIIFIVSGFWHGSNWTFIVWGGLNAVYFLPLLLTKKNRENVDAIAQGKYFPTITEFLKILVTFCLTLLAWIFFRAESLQHAFSIISEILSPSLLSMPNYSGIRESLITLILVSVFFIIEWLGRDQEYAIARMNIMNTGIKRWLAYYLIAMAIILFAGKEQVFIYFQF